MLRRLHPLLFWPLAVVLVVALACLLAAPVHALLMDVGLMSREPLAQDHDKAFLQVFRRLLLIPLVLVFLWRVRPWREAGMGGFGLRPTRARLLGAVRGYGLTLLVLCGLLGWQLAMGWLTWEDPLRWGTFAGRIGRYLVAGTLIALVEEWFFRGWLLRRATRDVGPLAAPLAVSAVYALVHAFRPTVLTVSVSHDAAGAFEALRGWIAFMTDVQAFGPSFVGLLCFSLLLVAAWRRTGSLWLPIGIHAAGILVLFSYGALTHRHPPRTWAGTRLLYDGPVLWGIALSGAALLWWRARAAGPGDGSSDGTRDDPAG